MELKVQITVDLISIQSGHTIHSHKFEPFDFNNEKELKKALDIIYKSMKEMQLAEDIEKSKDNKWKDK